MPDPEILGTMPSQRALDNVQFEFDSACESTIDAVARKGSIEYAKYNWQNVPFSLRVTLRNVAEKDEDDLASLSSAGGSFVTGAIVGLMLGRKLISNNNERRHYFTTVNRVFELQMTHDSVEETVVANGQSAVSDIAGRGYWKLLALVSAEPYRTYRERTSQVYSHSVAYMAAIAHTERLSREIERAQLGNFNRTFRLDSATNALRYEADVLASGALSDESLHRYLTGPANS